MNNPTRNGNIGYTFLEINTTHLISNLPQVNFAVPPGAGLRTSNKVLRRAGKIAHAFYREVLLIEGLEAYFYLYDHRLIIEVYECPVYKGHKKAIRKALAKACGRRIRGDFVAKECPAT